MKKVREVSGMRERAGDPELLSLNTLKEMSAYWADKHGDLVAIRYLNKEKQIEERTYRQITSDSDAFTTGMVKNGLCGKHVAVIGTSSYEWFISFVGIANSGSVCIPIDIKLPVEEILEEINRGDVSAVVYAPEFIEVAKAIKAQHEDCFFIEMSESKEAIGVNLGQFLDYEGHEEITISPDQLCLIMFTSGTTGKSKGVMLTHKNLSENTTVGASTCVFDRETGSMLSILPIHHIWCIVVDFLMVITLGIIVNINDDLPNIFKNIKRFKADTIAMVPMIFNFIIGQFKLAEKRNPGMDKAAIKAAVLGEHFKRVVVSGSFYKLETADYIETFGIEFITGYGMTEVACHIATDNDGAKRRGSLGRVMPGMSVKIVEDEIWVKGASVTSGYYKDLEATQKAFDGEWLKTGDLGYVDEDGFIYLTGRKKFLIITSSGENISPEPLEEQMKEYPIVKEAVVYQQKDVIVAEIFPNADYIDLVGITDVKGELDQVIRQVNQSNPSYKQIMKTILREKDFNKTTSQKVKRESFIHE